MGKKILVVDDETEILEAIEERLKANNFSVIKATNGDEGLQKWKDDKPDLIILDVKMPEMDGYTFVREAEARDDLGKIPIIVLTAKESMKDLFELEGIKEYVVKPFDGEDLIRKVRKHLS